MNEFTFEEFMIFADNITIAQFNRDLLRFNSKSVNKLTDIEYFNMTKDHWENPDALYKTYNQIAGKTQTGLI